MTAKRKTVKRSAPKKAPVKIGLFSGATNKKNNKMPTSTKVLIILGIFAFLFIVTMIVTFWVKDSVPDTLIQYVLGAGGVEALMLAGIKISKVITEGNKDIAAKAYGASNPSPIVDTVDDIEEEVVER